MVSKDHNGVPATGEPGQLSQFGDIGQLGKPGQLEDRVADVLKEDITRRERAVVDDETAVVSREKAVTARETAAESREDAAHQREGSAEVREGEAQERETAAASRERRIRTAGARGNSGDHLLMLQEANANLVTTSIEAQKLTEQVQAAQDSLVYLANHDALTDLPNRMLLHDRLGQAIELTHRQGNRLAVMFMDLDQFKHVNDSLGHAVGDQLLQSVAHRLVGSVRLSDTVCRLGGDEFILLLRSIDHAEGAMHSAEKVLEALAPPHHIGGHELHIGASIGISIYPEDGLDAETLIKHADTAMYHAKESGRNDYRFFETNMNARAVERQSIEVGLRQALEQQEFLLLYQPKINLHSGAIVGAEALIRWQHPERGLLEPAQFVPIAEDSSLILPIDRWVLSQACRQARAWQNAGLPPITVSVNASALEFRDKDFLENVRMALEESRLEPQYLELELTESVLMRDAEATGSVLHALADLSINLVIDDFGTGYSSLSYLRQFPINALKIDQSFVNRMIHSPDDAAIVSAVISMAKALRLRVIAEGIETAEQYAFLLAQQCDDGQGYFFGPPVKAEALASLLQTGLPPALPQ